MLVLHLEVTGSIPAVSIFFLLDKQSLLFFHPLEPIISCTVVAGRHLPSKTNPAKSYGMFKNKNKKSQTHNICVPGITGTHNILQRFYGKH
jgi:hypothetical protein